MNRFCVVLGAVVLTPCFVMADPNYTMYGTVGVIDMPNAEMASDGTLAISQGYFDGALRTTITSQIFPRVSASFRYSGHGQNGDEALGFANWDRSFDLRFQVMKETQSRPAVAIGLNDFIGTGRYSGEYIVATKNIGKLTATAGLGFGRLASAGGVQNPISRLQSRSKWDSGRGGTLSATQWFRGDIAAFGGLSYQFTPKLSGHVEYSSDDYDIERAYFDQKTPYNFGIKYQQSESVSVGAYYLHGSKLALSAHMTLDPLNPAAGSGLDPSPLPVRVRDVTGTTPVTATDFGNLINILALDGFETVALSADNAILHIQTRSKRYRSSAQAIGRIARIASQFASDSIETFKIDLIEYDVPAMSVTISRRDLEISETSLEAQKTTSRIISYGDNQDLLAWTKPEKLLSWYIAPYFEYSLFDPDEPIKVIGGVEAAAQYKLGQGLQIDGKIRKPVISSYKSSIRESDSVLPHVRSDGPKYNQQGDPSIHHLTVSKYTKLSPDIYARVTAGYLEPMYAGVSGEVLWKPSDSRLGLGIEVNHVKKRAYDQLFGLRDYEITTGHASVYYEMTNSLTAQLDVGQYLAGDKGATLTVARDFNNGWRVGGYATLTDVPFDDFGEGSFDKGVFITMPMDWVIGRPSKLAPTMMLNSLSRDGGARLNVEGRLYNKIAAHHKAAVDREIGRFWK